MLSGFVIAHRLWRPAGPLVARIAKLLVASLLIEPGGVACCRAACGQSERGDIAARRLRGAADAVCRRRRGVSRIGAC